MIQKVSLGTLVVETEHPSSYSD